MTAERDVQGIFKIIAAISSFRSVVGRSAGFWNRYYDSGRYEVVDASETHATVRIHDFSRCGSGSLHSDGRLV